VPLPRGLFTRRYCKINLVSGFNNNQNPQLIELPMKELMKQPSSWLQNGIKLNLSDQFRPFSFTEELQIRLEELLEKNQENLLNPDEQAELAGLLELDKIFSFINAKLAS
jgi:hypothetical protein